MSGFVSNYSIAEGLVAELTFNRCLRAMSYLTEWSSKREDIKRHIDLTIVASPGDKKTSPFGEHKTFDIKNEKRAARHHKAMMDEKILVEYQNVQGNPGWIEGEQDAIAFKMGDEFMVFDTEELREECYEKVPKNAKIHRGGGDLSGGRARDMAEEKNELYGRKGRQDAILYIRLEELTPALVYTIPIGEYNNGALLDWYNDVNDRIAEIKAKHCVSGADFQTRENNDEIRKLLKWLKALKAAGKDQPSYDAIP